jgi:hypothetical protein
LAKDRESLVIHDQSECNQGAIASLFLGMTTFSRRIL